MTTDVPFPRLGAGVGLRPRHYAAALAAGAALPDWFEVVPENFFAAGGRPREVLREAAALRPIALHGVSLSVGGRDPLDERYLERLAALCDDLRPPLVSDHLCWTTHAGRNTHDLLPLPFTGAEAARIAARVRRVQARLGRRILLENVSSYLAWRASTMSEWDFLVAVAEEAGAGILLDVNNVYVSARNHGFDPLEYLDAIPPARVGQIHLAGHADRGGYLFDTHDAPVPAPVWALYERALERFGPVSTLVEWDGNLPSWEALLGEAGRARERLAALPAREPAPPPARVARAQRAGTPPHRASPGEEEAIDFLCHALATGDAGGAEAFVDGGALSPRERVEIYAASHRARLHDALLEDFGATDALLGHPRFHEAALAYARAHPSRSPTLRDFGARFAAFLRERGEHAAADLAALEWARVEAFDAADATPLGADALAAVPPDRWPSLCLAAHPSLRLVPVAFRVDEAWRAADAGASPATPLPARGALRVWREGTTVYHAWTGSPEAAALAALAEGRPFAEAAARLAAELHGTTQEAAARLAAALRDWLADGLFTGLRS